VLCAVLSLLITYSAFANQETAAKLAPILSFLLNSDNTPPALNDTGITFGGEFPSGNNSACSGELIAQQDCSHGRDVTDNDNSDGHAGFSFTKLDVNGNDLPANANTWSCVQDNVTGLMWEVKTTDGGEQDRNNTYDWGGLTAQGRDHPNRQGSYFDDWNALVNHANNTNLCGFSDWRVPEREELRSIVNYNGSSPSIDTDYFPNTVTTTYWSSSAFPTNSSSAWSLTFGVGSDINFPRNFGLRVRLVR